MPDKDINLPELMARCLEVLSSIAQPAPTQIEKAGPLAFLYMLFIAVDANFKLKRKERKLDDIDFITDTGIFVNQHGYQEHISNYIEQPEHNAIVQASIQNTPDYTVSGVGLVLCSRHLLVCQNGVGDLQKEERYCNMDYIVLLALIGVKLLCIFIRMGEFEKHMQILSMTKIRTAIPSWHINGHVESYQENYNIRYMKGVAPSIREMVLAARCDALSNHWNGWNFHKIVGFCSAFAKKFKEAIKMQKKHKATFIQFLSTFSATPEMLEQWKKQVEEWKANPSKPNSYKESTQTITLQNTRRNLQNKEAAMAAIGKLPAHSVIMTRFLVTGLELEDHQYIYSWF
ncbi:hypothetical protein JR316_0012499 [Psilocybe cubensis]|uniref:Uncharacterized protein n=1 Tax=Psilocybe cubensis TaxID=181762 RepID=A0ACB8GIE1_PSICU|nr:hypothetical protein JR316_0012499 [Psilocybe cubensis]KAH9475388.1 hypothetical protein JR316_0012499 [Psilocybe cubensis]